MTPLQAAVALSSPILGIVVWWGFRWSRKHVGIASMRWTLWKMRRRLRRGAGEEVDTKKLMEDVDELQRIFDDLVER